MNANRAADPPRVRLAELVAALSLGVDLGFGQPMEHVLRQCMIALRLAECVGLDEEERSVVYYTALMINVGCHSDAHEQAKWFGDDITLKSGKYDHELGSMSGALAMLRLVGSGNPPLHRFRVGIEFAVSGHRELDGMIAQHAALARRSGRAARSVGRRAGGSAASYEQWDGKGWPGNLKGEAIPVASRLSQIGEFVEVAHRIGGTGAATDLAQARAGTQFDPTLSAVLCANAQTIFDGLDAGQTWDAVIGAEPALGVLLSRPQFDAALLAIADFVDLKSPFTLGHARAVSTLGRRQPGPSWVWRRRGPDAPTRRPRPRPRPARGCPTPSGTREGPLGAGEWERVRMCPYLTERMLRQSAALAPLGAIAVQHRERLDGSGYPRGLSGGAISIAARILGSADAYQSMCEPRPHREALTPEVAAKELRAEVKAGRMDGDVVEAVLGAAGHRVARRREGRPVSQLGRSTYSGCSRAACRARR